MTSALRVQEGHTVQKVQAEVNQRLTSGKSYHDAFGFWCRLLNQRAVNVEVLMSLWVFDRSSE